MSKNTDVLNFLNNIDKLIEEKKYLKAEKYLRDYIQKNNSEHYAIKIKLGRILISNNKLEEAIEILQPLLYISESHYRARAIFTLAYAYANLHDYEKSLEYIQLYIEDPTNYEKNCLNKLKDLKREIYEYMRLEKNKTILKNSHYSEQNTLKHLINAHGYEWHCTEKAYFNSEINIIDLFHKIKEEIDCRLDITYSFDATVRIYYFYYESIGYDYNGKLCNILKVVTDFNCNIISMYPVLNEINDVNINNLSTEKTSIEHAPQKINARKSQIDKFNQRYGKTMQKQT